MNNLHFSGIIAKFSGTFLLVDLQGLIISTETNPYYRYFRPYYNVNRHFITAYDEKTDMRYLIKEEYFYEITDNIPLCINLLYRVTKDVKLSYNFFIYRSFSCRL